MKFKVAIINLTRTHGNDRQAMRLTPDKTKANLAMLLIMAQLLPLCLLWTGVHHTTLSPRQKAKKIKQTKKQIS